MNLLLHLLGELTRGYEHQPTWPTSGVIAQALDQNQTEGNRLTRTRRGFAADVFAGQAGRHGQRLNLGRRGDFSARKRRRQRLGNAQLQKIVQNLRAKYTFDVRIEETSFGVEFGAQRDEVIRERILFAQRFSTLKV